MKGCILKTKPDFKNSWYVFFGHTSAYHFSEKTLKFEQTCKALFPHLCRGLPNDKSDIDLNVYLTIYSLNWNYTQIWNPWVMPFSKIYTFYMFELILFVLWALLGSSCQKMLLVSLLSLKLEPPNNICPWCLAFHNFKTNTCKQKIWDAFLATYVGNN